MHRFADGRGDWLIAARRSNLDEVADLADFDQGEPNYADGFARVGYRLDDGTQLTLHALAATDTVKASDSDDIETARADYHNAYVWGTVEHAGRRTSLASSCSRTRTYRPIGVARSTTPAFGSA
jgi:hypothetical protein